MNAISKVLAIVAIILAGSWLIGFAYSYTSASENTGNTSMSEYVVLSQSEYSFGSGDMTFNTVTTRDQVTGGPFTVYRISGDTLDPITISAVSYTPVVVGERSSSLVGQYTGPENPSSLQDVYVQTVGDGFADISALGWYYVIMVTCDGEPDQFVYWDGDPQNEWQGSFDMTIVSNKTTKAYTTQLCIAVPTAGSNNTNNIPNKIIDDGTIRFVYSKVTV